MNRNFVDGEGIPLGLGMALAQNQSAMSYFSSLSAEERQRIIDHTHTVESKQEMQDYVNNLGRMQ